MIKIFMMMIHLFQLSSSLYHRNFRMKKVVKYSAHKYENEYIEFYNKYKDPLLCNNADTKHKLVENNLDSYQVFEKNYQYLETMNQVLMEKNDSLTLGVNQFMDQVDFDENTNCDLMKYSLDGTNKLKSYSSTYFKPFRHPIAYMTGIMQQQYRFSWNDTNFLSSVKNQENCGSCWAFSTTSAVETFMRMNNFTVDRLSEQELVDCSMENNGCSGGIMHKAMDYVIANRGLYSEFDYKYNSRDNDCQVMYNISRVKGSDISKYEFIIPKSPQDIMISLTKAPIAIGLDANNFYFRFYQSGVIDVPSNFSKVMNHAVLLVGYDKDEKGYYWIIQNSWGTSWGEDGFCKIRIKNDLDNQGTLLCQMYGVYPTK